MVTANRLKTHAERWVRDASFRVFCDDVLGPSSLAYRSRAMRLTLSDKKPTFLDQGVVSSCYRCSLIPTPVPCLGLLSESRAGCN